MPPRPPYKLAEIFYSLQGEGLRTGTANVFVRFAGCNLKCRANGAAGFDCDTDHRVKMERTAMGIVAAAVELMPKDTAIIFTGGEPFLQLDEELVNECKRAQVFVAVETNGSIPVKPELLDSINYIACSPKEGTRVVLTEANELRFVMDGSVNPPDYDAFANAMRPEGMMLSPRFLPDGRVDPAALKNCVDIIRKDPRWQLSVQLHKLIGIP